MNSKKKGMSLLGKQRAAGWTFLAPATIMIAIMSFYPMIRAFIISLQTGAGANMRFADPIFSNYKRILADKVFQQETASARREINKALSAEQLTIKRDWTRKQNELKEKIFSEVKGLLESFTKTPEYENYLTAKIKEALDFAGNDDITIYLSPEDRSLAEKLQHTTGTAIQLAKDSFLGGIRATIPQKNILIDHSFAGNFEAAYKEFKFDGGPEHE